MASGRGRGYDRLMSEKPYLMRLREERAQLLAMLEPLERGEVVSRDALETETRIHFLHRQLGDLDVSIRSEERRRNA